MELDRKLEVLVVDDDDVTRMLLSKAVRVLGHDCRVAEDGERAWVMLGERRADVVICDWEMPKLSGVDLCKRIRASAEEEGPYTYFILMTGWSDRARMHDGMAAGADDYQHKPVDLDELEARLVSASRVVALHERLVNKTANLRRDSKRFYALSRTDPLTGAGNRLALHEEVEQLRARAKRYGHRYCVAMADVDHFKNYNDTFGHIAGDEVLRLVTDAMKRTIRTSDALYRYGGEEFAIVFAEESLDDATLGIERVRREIESMAIPGPDGIVTVSFGVAELDIEEDTSAEDWLRRADAALYRAKQSGRNRVEKAVLSPRCGTDREVTRATRKETSHGYQARGRQETVEDDDAA